MTDPVAFLLAVVALLATPGPTNTLLAASGAAAGLARSLRLVPAEIAGYGLAIGLLTTVVGPAAAAAPLLPAALKAAAAAYLAWSAVRLWRAGGAALAGVPAPATAARVFATTLLNPKALVFAFAIFPAGSPASFALHFAAFAAAVLAVSTGWIAAGAAIARSPGGVVTPARVSRVAAAVLALFSVLLVAGASAAVLTG